MFMVGQLVESPAVEAKDLRRWREQEDLTQEQLAALLEVAPNTVSRWELGERKIPPFLERALKQIESERKNKKASN
jgi:transcriptional regulator with XRE-family HTH domain